MAPERTCWAEGVGLTQEQIEALTLISEEVKARGLEVGLDPRDVWAAWPPALSEVGAVDLADRVRQIEAE